MLNVNCRFTITIEKRRTIANSLVQNNRLVGNLILVHVYLGRQLRIQLSIMKAAQKFYDILVKKQVTKYKLYFLKVFLILYYFFHNARGTFCGGQ